MTTDSTEVFQFNKICEVLGFENVNEILFNWNESELSEDGSEILIYVDSRSYGPKTGGSDKVEKKEFIDWLKSDGPFDPEVYGEDIGDDNDWLRLIEKARNIIS